jgi:hypothetical protein
LATDTQQRFVERALRRKKLFLAIVVLILLNSRQNLRQYRFASFIEDYKKQGV